MSTQKNGSNGATKTATNGSAVKTNGKSVKTEVPVVSVKEQPKKEASKPNATPLQTAQARMESWNKLNALHEDIIRLQKAKQDFDQIQTFSEIEICVVCNGRTEFKTSRTDTVESALLNIGQSIDEKLAKANTLLAEFEF